MFLLIVMVIRNTWLCALTQFKHGDNLSTTFPVLGGRLLTSMSNNRDVTHITVWVLGSEVIVEDATSDTS